MKSQNPLPLTQTLIKQLIRPEPCPRYVVAYYVDRTIVRLPTLPQLQGQYFEYKFLGNLPKDGNLPVLPKTKQGKVTVIEQRIDSQVSKSRERWQELFSGVISRGITFTGDLHNIRLAATLDALVAYRGRATVVDCKLTSNVNRTDGVYAWGNYREMEHLQAYLYLYITDQVLGGRPHQFFYYVVDTTPEENYAWIEIQPTYLDYERMKDQIRMADERLKAIVSHPNEVIPTMHNCRQCGLSCNWRLTD